MRVVLLLESADLHIKLVIKKYFGNSYKIFSYGAKQSASNVAGNSNQVSKVSFLGSGLVVTC